MGGWVIAEELNLEKKDLNGRFRNEKTVPKLLVDEQKQQRLDILSDPSFHLDAFNRVITRNER